MMEITYKKDGHIHSPFCPHGTQDKMETYVEEAIGLGREEMSFTEHFPLPGDVIPESFARECALIEEEVPKYLEAVREIKATYGNRIKINAGFEVDYLEGCEEEIKCQLMRYGSEIEDAILSVHFVKVGTVYYAVDILSEFEKLVEVLGGVEAIYDLYYETVLKSIKADLGPHKPKRIGHLSLVRIFNQKYPICYEDKGMFEAIALQLAEGGYEIDFNVAGLRRVYCGETYPSGKLLELIKAQGIRCVGGSDSHAVGQMKLLS